MPRIYDRGDECEAGRPAKITLNGRQRLTNWKLRAAPMTVACRKLGINEDTLRDWVAAGRIRAFRGRGGHIRYDVANAVQGVFKRSDNRRVSRNRERPILDLQQLAKVENVSMAQMFERVLAVYNRVENRRIGAEAVSHALTGVESRPDTPERRAFVSAIERLSLRDAGWACKIASYVEQEARQKPV
jgi:Helix-turn-helix domain